MSVRLQELLHKYEVGAGAWIMRLFLLVLAVVSLGVVYDLNAFRNLSTSEGMDAAQLARNLAEGRGFTTSFIRPFSLSLLSKKAAQSPAPALTNSTSTLPRHPDLTNPPLYPLLLAGVLKANPFGEPDLSKQETFSIYLPDLWIALFNQLLLALAAWMIFRLAKRLFDLHVAWASTIVFLVTELFWRFSVSGLSTMLLIVLFLALVGVLARLESRSRETPAPRSILLWYSVLAGIIVGAAAMTRYSLGCLIIPVMLLLLSLPSPQRISIAILALGAFSVVIVPWTVRNYEMSGTPFGTAGFAIMETTPHFPGDQLQRSLHPPLSQINTEEYWQKLTTNMHEILSHDLPRLGGSWIAALFLAGLLMPFRNPVLGRLRLFLIMCMAVLVVAQALGRTVISTESPDLNSENLLVIVAPLVFIFGVSLFFTLRDQLQLQGPTARGLLWVAFYAAMGAPFLLMLFSPHPSPIVYPPYYPPWIQQKSRAVGENQVIMSDMPWAVAWYGKRPSVWLSLKYKDKSAEPFRDDFSSINRLQPISGLYLTAKSLKTIEIKALSDWSKQETFDQDWDLVRKMVTELGQSMVDQNVKQADIDHLKSIYGVVARNWLRGGGDDWDSFVLGIFVKREVPTGFPLQRAIGGIAPEIFLTESERETGKTIQSPKQ